MQIRNILLSILMMAALAANAQLAQFRGGIEAGIMGTQVDGDTLSGYNKAAVRAGGFIERPISQEMSIQFGMLYTQKGSKADVEKSDVGYYEINLHYIDMPFTGRYYHESGVFGEAGIALGYLFSQKEIGYIHREYHETEDAGFNSLEWSGHLGIGYKLFPHTFVHAQFNYSLLKIRGKYQSKIPGVRAGQYNNTLMIAMQIYLGEGDRS